MLEIAYQNLVKNKARTALSLAALVIGVVTIIAMVSVTAGIRSMVTDSLAAMNGIIVWEKDALDQPWSHVPADYEQKFEAIPGVRAAFPEVYAMISEIDGKKATSSSLTGQMGIIGLVGLDPEKEQEREGLYYGLGVAEGRWLKPGDKNVVILGNIVADDYDKRVGSTIELDGKDFRVVGILEESQLFGGYMVSTLDVTRELAGIDSDTVNDFTIQTYRPQDQDRVAKAIEFKYDDMQAMSAQSASEEVSGLMNTFDMVFLIISLIALLTAGVVIVNTMLMSVMDRQKEIGVLKAVGWTSDDVLKLVLMESALIGVFGGIIGCIVGSIVVLVINGFIDFTLTLTYTNIVGAFCFSVVAGIIGGIYPAWVISKTDPIEALRME